MPRARRNPSPRKRRGEADTGANDLRELALFLEESKGFRLGLATYETPGALQSILEQLAESLADRPVHLTRLDLSKFPDETQLLQRLRDHLRDHPAPEGKTPAVMVTGLEAHLDYRDLGHNRHAPQSILRNANIQRDAYPRLVPATVVLWLLPTAATLFVQEAPDLWHWRAGSFRFASPPGARHALEQHHREIPMFEADGPPSSEKIDRIALLRDLLLAAESEGDRDSLGNQGRRANLLQSLGLAYCETSDFGHAKSYIEEAHDLFRKIGDRLGESLSRGNLGAVYLGLGQLEKAVGLFQRNLTEARELGIRRYETLSLIRLGSAYINSGQLTKGIGYLEQSLVLSREIGDPPGERRSLGNLGAAWLRLGQMEKATGYFEQSLALAREIGDRRAEGTSLGNLGSAFARLGLIERAVGYFEQSLALAREIGDRRGEGVFLGTLGQAYADLGLSEKAAGLLLKSLEIGRQIQSPEVVQIASNGLERLRKGFPASTEQLPPDA